MKKTILFSTLIISVICFSAFKNNVAKSKLFPAIETFYSDVAKVQPPADQTEALRDFSSYIVQAANSDTKLNLVFACADNSFKSTAAQLILQSLANANKINKLDVSSLGFQPKEINPQLIKVLTKHGFQITSQNTVGNKTVYEIKVGDKLPTIKLFTKDATDVSIPKSNFLLLKLCSATETNCTDVQGYTHKRSVMLDAVADNITEEQADKMFTDIAAKIVYAFNLANQ